jgi:exosortase
MTAQPVSTPRDPRPLLVFAALLGVAVLWSYWTTLGTMALRWWEDPQYSHGWLVPVFAVYVLWTRRESISLRALNASWVGFFWLGAGLGMRLAGTRYGYAYFDQLSILPSLAGLIVLVGGRAAWSWSWPALAFLGFMVPLPDVLSLALSAPMQSFATTVSTFALQVLGRPAIAEGNVILLGEIELGIVEACSGLRMLVVFFALSTAVAMLIHKPLWEKLLIAASAVPIALASNVLRITITGVLCDSFGNELGIWFHDFAGLLMPFIGMIFLGIEWWILGQLLIEPARQPASAISLQRVAVSPAVAYAAETPPRRASTPALEAVSVGAEE